MPANGNQKYPWDLWFNGREWELIWGEDFLITPRNFQASALTCANRRGLKVQVTRKEDNGIVTVQRCAPALVRE